MNVPTVSGTQPANAQLQALGASLRAQRKALRVSGTAAAEAAGISRVTLHRIEKGEPTVAMGAWFSVAAALGLELTPRRQQDTATSPAPAKPAGWIPVAVNLADYPQLKALAWQVHGSDTLSPLEALSIYERNARHLDVQNMSPDEAALLQALRTGLGNSAPWPTHV